ncbi:hypothetical protein [Clavibacter tessellarius]|uniref:hypothetical protein n=1 Tax=Clavibacter tessellarius TaxID=31965 RepID=UPI0010BD1415|nr:hypothetical protein [Clavibacter michiganensis]MDA3805161.1 hypothetical protein [Clavibacter sp. CT19]
MVGIPIVISGASTGIQFVVMCALPVYSSSRHQWSRVRLIHRRSGDVPSDLAADGPAEDAADEPADQAPSEREYRLPDSDAHSLPDARADFCAHGSAGGLHNSV